MVYKQSQIRVENFASVKWVEVTAFDAFTIEPVSLKQLVKGFTFRMNIVRG